MQQSLVGGFDYHHHGVRTDLLEILKVGSHLLFYFLHVIIPFFLAVVGYLWRTLWPYAVSKRLLFTLLTLRQRSSRLAGSF